jgi:hypothetical protein
MSKKAMLSQMNKQLGNQEDTKEKKTKKSPAQKRDEEAKPLLDSNIPRGERADFLKITLTIPADLLTELRALGMKRKANKMKDTDTSALIREALVDFLNKHRAD